MEKKWYIERKEDGARIPVRFIHWWPGRKRVWIRNSRVRVLYYWHAMLAEILKSQYMTLAVADDPEQCLVIVFGSTFCRRYDRDEDGKRYKVQASRREGREWAMKDFVEWVPEGWELVGEKA